MIEEYNTQEEILNRIEELTAQDECQESDMYVITKQDDDLSLLRAKTDVIVEDKKVGWLDRFMGVVSGKQKVKDAFEKMNLTEEERTLYYNDLENGKYLLYVDEDYCQINYPERHSEYVSETAPIVAGKKIDDSFDYDKYNTEYETHLSDPDLSDEKKIELREEKLRVDKHRVLAGEVTVDKYIVENDQTIDVPVSREEIYIERRPVSRSENLGDIIADLKDGEVVKIPLMEEKVDVTKTNVVREEIVIGKRRVDSVETIHDTVKSEQIRINDPTNTISDKQYDTKDDRSIFDKAKDALTGNNNAEKKSLVSDDTVVENCDCDDDCTHITTKDKVIKK